MSKSSKNLGFRLSDMQERSAKALRANLLKRKSQSKTRSEIGKRKNKDKLNG